jgi:SPP1 family predicted phage head-tail adaptor
MRAGALRRRVSFQTRDTGLDGVGGQAVTWTTLLTTWVDMTPSVGKELIAAQAMHLSNPSTITARWQTALSVPTVVAAMRILYGARVFDIHSYQNTDERNRELVLIATEGMSDG